MFVISLRGLCFAEVAVTLENSVGNILNSKGGQSAAFAVSATISIAAHYQL